MKVLIVGSRSITELDISGYIPKTTDLIISGGAKGVDTIAEEFADKYRISKLIMRPQYDMYKKSAPLKRNIEMVDLCDMVIAFWDGQSRGTKSTIDYAIKKGKKVEVVKMPKGH